MFLCTFILSPTANCYFTNAIRSYNCVCVVSSNRTALHCEDVYTWLSPKARNYATHGVATRGFRRTRKTNGKPKKDVYETDACAELNCPQG